MSDASCRSGLVRFVVGEDEMLSPSVSTIAPTVSTGRSWNCSNSTTSRTIPENGSRSAMSVPAAGPACPASGSPGDPERVRGRILPIGVRSRSIGVKTGVPAQGLPGCISTAQMHVTDVRKRWATASASVQETPSLATNAARAIRTSHAKCGQGRNRCTDTIVARGRQTVPQPGSAQEREPPRRVPGAASGHGLEGLK